MAKPKKISEGYLERAALHYLGRFSSTEANLRSVLERKVRRRLEEGQEVSSEHRRWIADVAQKCVKYGYVDDALYAKSRYESLLRKGKPLRVISQDLRYKGVPQDIIQELFAAIQDEPEVDIDLSAAAAYAKRRRFGPFRRADRYSEEKVEKERAAMMRAGFPYQMVQRILDATEEEIIQLLP
ncbi:RecX family transcriptional regulator [Kordiimonas sp. SCSIO 12603]|uniref:regulatory protein RecX n=1 Tax=Kordiimonas sp. SCSIO 12603 TaxID=2829596 RepID=UPI002102D357|nr:RecX family transcriptional regulator [Kordiimonas sp. SCSIO 12603]UTW57737.1 RecX family transcriptional regulator [Kordiimonas sp. SCSIO 12603]